MIIRLDRNAVAVFEQGVEQRAVRIAAGVPHDVDLIRRRINERQQAAVVVRFQITDGFDVGQVSVVVEIRDRFIVLVQLIPIAEDDRIVLVFQFAVDMVDLECGTFREIQIGHLRVVEIQQQYLIRQKVIVRNLRSASFDMLEEFGHGHILTKPVRSDLLFQLFRRVSVVSSKGLS